MRLGGCRAKEGGKGEEGPGVGRWLGLRGRQTRLGVLRNDVEHGRALADDVDVLLEHQEGGGAVVVERNALVDVGLRGEVQRLREVRARSRGP